MSEEELPKGTMQCLKPDQLGGKDWNNLDGEVEMRKIQAQGHNMTHQSPDTLGTARSAGTAKELSGLIGMTLVPQKISCLRRRNHCPHETPTSVCGSCMYKSGSSTSQLFQEEE